MSTTPDPTPVDPDLSRNWVDPTPVEVPLDAATAPGPEGVPLPDEPLSSPAGGAADAVPPVGEQARRTAAGTAAAMREADLKALYAAAGATQVLVGAVRDTVTETSRWANARLSELRFRRAELAKQAEQMRQRAGGVPEEVKAAPEVAKNRVADLQQQATGTYSDLANRGHRVLHDVRTEVVSRIDPAFDRIEERLEAARRAIRGAAAETTLPPVPPAAPVAEPPVPAPAAPVPAPGDAVVEDLGAQDAALVEEVVIEPVEPTDRDTTPER